MSAASYKATEMILRLPPYLIMIDRSEDAKFELQSGEYCRFQFILLKKIVTSVIDSAVLH